MWTWNFPPPLGSRSHFPRVNHPILKQLQQMLFGKVILFSVAYFPFLKREIKLLLYIFYIIYKKLIPRYKTYTAKEYL